VQDGIGNAGPTDEAFQDAAGYHKSIFGDWGAVQPNVEVKEKTVKAVMKKMKDDVKGGSQAARAALQELFDQYDRNGDGSLTMDGTHPAVIRGTHC
jgi:uncharacterized Ntn-hydrolase superfamily protein